MTVSEKQLEANRANAQLGGVKTDEGKAIVKYNALKHGLLAKEVVITVGDGAENPEEFTALLEDLTAQLKPEGTLEEMLVEKIAVAYWRLRRAYRYEVGLVRKELDDATEEFYERTDYDGETFNKTDEEVKQEIEGEELKAAEWQKDKAQLLRMHKQGRPLEETYESEEIWDWLSEGVSDPLPTGDAEVLQPKDLRESLNKEQKWSDDDIWEALIEVCDERTKECEKQITDLRKEGQKSKLRLQVIKRLGNIPSKEELDRLLRYEGTIERQFYKAMNQLERLQRLRAGDSVPAPVEVDVDVNGGQSA